jgi:hypothetical protein
MVGDAQVLLLRIVPVEGRDGEMIIRVFDPIQYCPLLQRRFQTVKIDIRDDTGFNRDFAACLIFLPCTISPTIFNPVFKASRPRVFAPFFNKGLAALKSPPKILPSSCPL